MLEDRNIGSFENIGNFETLEIFEYWNFLNQQHLIVANFLESIVYILIGNGHGRHGILVGGLVK